jgi:2,3-bisphosphoglycerate-dependent phosphoglycerate mutase
MSEVAMTSIVLVRHGETIWNRDGRVQGTLDSPLSERGLAQAEAVAQALADEGVQRIYSSDSGRTQATARALAERTRLPIRLDARLRERNLGRLQGLTWAEIEVAYPEAFARINAREPGYEPPEGESSLAFRDRVVAAMTDIAIESHGERAVVVTHGGVVGIMYRHVREMPLEAKRDYALFNASINRFRVVDGRWHMDVWGYTSHLEGLAAIDDG